uniref:Virion protein U34 n=1 Tax=Anatid alphaherpesvirus 2 TaxID=3080522 RepID=A0AAU0K6Z4_9ALPH
MAGVGRGDSRRRAGGLISRLKLVVPGGLKAGDYDPALAGSCPSRVPTRCAFQFSGVDGAEEIFPVEYVMRMMSDWASEDCDPYVHIQNTGVSVLIQGFFNPPSNAAKTPVSADRSNVVLVTTASTGISLSAVERMKAASGVDGRPFQACLNVSCFVRLPQVQLAFRFMGPGDPARTLRLLDLATETYESKIKQQQQARLRLRTSDAPDASAALTSAAGIQQLVPESATSAAGGGALASIGGGLRSIFSAPRDAKIAGRVPQWLLTACVTSLLTLLVWVAIGYVRK